LKEEKEMCNSPALIKKDHLIHCIKRYFSLLLQTWCI